MVLTIVVHTIKNVPRDTAWTPRSLAAPGAGPIGQIPDVRDKRVLQRLDLRG